MTEKIRPEQFLEVSDKLNDIWIELEHLKPYVYSYGIDFGDKFSPLLKNIQDKVSDALSVAYDCVDECELDAYLDSEEVES